MPGLLSSSVLNDCPLMVHNLPTFGSAPPDRRATGSAHFVLEERVGQQVDIVSKSSAMEVHGLPNVDMRDRMTLFQLVEHVGP